MPSTKHSQTNEVALDFARDWVEFPDPVDPAELWKCDLTWLTSSWQCIYGAGCKGIFEERPFDGCCSQGAHFTGKEDEKRVRDWAARLTPETWQFFAEGQPAKSKGKLDISEKDDEGDKKTRVVEDGCIFLNRPGFAGGEGCAFHHLAIREGVHFVETKPDVCWQLPLRQSYEELDRGDGKKISVNVIGEFDRRAWGEGGEELDWYCSGNPEAHIASEPLYITNKTELIAMMNQKAYEVLADICDQRMAAQSALKSRNLPLFIVHPATLEADRLKK
ncbi:MAG: hypothetical protein CK545_02665 [Actinobacteria bacterium]|nr:MAG: hypothetical protein CK545_02665 [Actinomycetota bacterium]